MVNIMHEFHGAHLHCSFNREAVDGEFLIELFCICTAASVFGYRVSPYLACATFCSAPDRYAVTLITHLIDTAGRAFKLINLEAPSQRQIINHNLVLYITFLSSTRSKMMPVIAR